MNSKLSMDQRHKFESWINSKTTLIGKCPVCAERRWTLLDDILEVRPFNGGGLVVGGATYPHVGLMCTNCGNTQFINAVVSGIISEREFADEIPPSGVADAG